MDFNYEKKANGYQFYKNQLLDRDTLFNVDFVTFVEINNSKNKFCFLIISQKKKCNFLIKSYIHIYFTKYIRINVVGLWDVIYEEYKKIKPLNLEGIKPREYYNKEEEYKKNIDIDIIKKILSEIKFNFSLRYSFNDDQQLLKYTLRGTGIDNNDSFFHSNKRIIVSLRS